MMFRQNVFLLYYLILILCADAGFRTEDDPFAICARESITGVSRPRSALAVSCHHSAIDSYVFICLLSVLLFENITNCNVVQ
jgi:hypothetical protein